MAGMEYTFSADVAPFVGAMGEAIAAAKEFESAVHGARDAELELGAAGAESAAGLAAQTAAMDAATHSTDKFQRKHSELGGVLRDSERAVQDLERAASDATSSGGGLSMLGSVGMPAAIAGLIGLAAGATPAILSLGAGFGAFGALAAPALYKVKTGLTAVTLAQQKYHAAQVAEQRNPTAANLKAEQKALENLKNTWAQMPAPVRGAVSEIRQFGKAWSDAARKSGIQKDALGDIKLAVKDARELIPTMTGLAKAAAPIVHGMLGDLGKEFKSQGFLSFIGTLKKDMAPAANALKSIGSAFGGFITQLTAKEAKPGTQMLQSIGKFLHTITPGTVTGLVGLTKGVTGLVNAMNQVASSSFMTHVVNAGKAIGRFLNSSTMKGSMGWQVLQAETKTLQQMHDQGFSRLGEQFQKSSNLKFMAHAQVKVKADGGDIRKQIEDAASKGGGGDIKVKGRVTLAGLGAGIKSQIANLKIPDSKVKISVSISGVGPAKAQMASVVAAAHHDASAAAAALNTLGAAGAAAGRALDQGLAGGILAGESSVVAAAASVAGAAAAAARKAAGIASPSKVWHGIGVNMIQGLILALQGGKAQVQAAARAITGAAAPFKDQTITQTIKKLREDVRKAFSAGDIGRHQRDGLIDFIDHGNQRLMKLAQQRAKIMGEIKAATALAKSVTQGAIGSADITSIAANVLAGQNKGVQGGTIQQGQKDQLEKIKQFTHAIRQLKREGLDKTSIKQLLAAGVSGGLPAAQRLLSEGPKAVKESARLQKEIIKASKQLGTTGANAAYESASQMGKGLADGLRAQLKPIVAAMQQIARALVATLRKELGLKPGEGLGGLLGSGGGPGGGGGGAGHHGPRRSHHGPGGMQMSPGGPGGLIHPGGPPHMRMHPGMHAQPIHVTVHVESRVEMSGQVLARSTQTHQLRHARRNIATGIKLANRAA